MGWPFSVAQPNLDSGLITVPTSSTTVPSTTNTTPLWVMGASFANTTTDTIVVTLTDGSGNVIIQQDIPPNSTPQPWNFNFMPVTGLKWVAASSGVTGKCWGYQ